jgi:uncharacterized protein YaaR (DUF327 family)
MSYREVAEIIGIKEVACRKLVSRAKASVDKDKVRNMTPKKRQEEFLAAFENAISQGNTAGLAALLSEDIKLSADGGGKVPTIRETIFGKDNVRNFLEKRLHKFWINHEWHLTEINGYKGAIIRNGESVVATVSLAYNSDNEVVDIYVMRNPHKIGDLTHKIVH